MRWIVRDPLNLVVFVALGLVGCAPASASNCTVWRAPRNSYVATLTLSNHSSLSIVKSTVLVDASHLGPGGGHRLFDSLAVIGPGQTRTIRGIEKTSARSWAWSMRRLTRGHLMTKPMRAAVVNSIMSISRMGPIGNTQVRYSIGVSSARRCRTQEITKSNRRLPQLTRGRAIKHNAASSFARRAPCAFKPTVRGFA